MTTNTVSIPEPVARLIKSPDAHKVLATVSPEGEPHAIVCASLGLFDDHICAADVFMTRTVMNLEKNPTAEFLVWMGKDAYSIKATVADRVTEGPIFDKMSASLEKFNMTVAAVYVFAATEIWDESASKTAGEKVI